MKLLLPLICLCLPMIATSLTGKVAVKEPERPFTLVRYNFSCPIRHTFFFHVWLISRPQDVGVVSVSNGISRRADSGFLKGTVPPRYNADYQLSVVMKHNCRRDGAVIVTKEDIVGNCPWNQGPCSMFYTKNLLETIPGLLPAYLFPHDI